MGIKEMRQKFGLTQKRFSEVTGIPKRTVESWEEGKRTPPEWLPKMIESFLLSEPERLESRRG